MELLIASRNVHKIREMRLILKQLCTCDLISLADFPDYVPPEENGKTFQENATLKAVHAAQALQRLTIADDSGLVVPALRGEPGVYSARYSGPNATDMENRTKLLTEMEDLPEEQRNAYFECWIAIASPEQLLYSAKGLCEGKILAHARGNGGFGYDPLFVKHDYNKTFSELDETTKNRVSHRRKALEKCTLVLEKICQKE